jgi:uncharacterized protein YbjT (DUF2867 family)
MRRFYAPSLWIPQLFLLANPNLHHGLLVKLNPKMTFIYVSGAGTDSTERGRLMWARVKGRTENALLQMPFKAVYLFRPAYIQPLHGIRTKTAWYGAVYALARDHSIRY